MREENSKITAAVGFLGAGGIASAMVKGLCRAEAFLGEVHVYNPSREKALSLKKIYPDRIVVADSNQAVLDNTSIVFPAVLPGVLRRLVPGLKFSENHRVVHLAAGIALGEAGPWFAPARSVSRAVPLPFASRRMGPVVLFGDDPLVRGLLELLGSVVEVATERDLEILAAVTGMMVSYYAIVGETVGWGVGKGSDFQSVLRYTTSMNEALSALMRSDCGEDIETFLIENATPGGMNELGLRITREAGVYRAWATALEEIGRRYDL